MPEDKAPEGPRVIALVYDGIDLRALKSDTDGHLQVDALSSALPSGAATQATLADILAKLDVALSTRALEAGGNLASILARLDVALSTRALEAGGNLAAILTALQKMDDWALETNKLWGYNDRYLEALVALDPPAGTFTFNFTAVPDGEVRIIQAINAADVTTARRCQLRVQDGTNAVALKDATQASSAEWVIWDGSILLRGGDRVQIAIYSVDAGDDLYARAWGYKMKVA